MDGKGGAEVAVKRAGKVARVNAVLGDDVGLQIGQVVSFEEVHDCVAIGLALRFPVDVGAEMGDGREDVECLPSGRREGGVGQGRHVQVEGEVPGQVFVAEDVAQEAGVVRVHHDVVVGQTDVSVLPLSPEVDDEEGHGVALAFDAAVAVAGPLFSWDEVEVGPSCVGVGDDCVGLVNRTDFESDTLGTALIDEDAINFGVKVDFDTEFLQEACESVDDGAGAAESVMDAPFTLKVVDENVDTGGGEGVAADEEGLEGEAAAEKVVLEEF